MKTVYLCGGINGLGDAECKSWRAEATDALRGCFAVKDPMRRDFRGHESQLGPFIVEADLRDISNSDVLLVNASRPSWGTAMEVYAAHTARKCVVTFGAPSNPSPWLAQHSHAMFADLAAALAFITAHCS